MRQLTYAVAAAFVLFGFSTFFTACHDDGGIKLNTPISGDDTPDTPDDGGGDGGGGGDGDGGGGNGGGGGGGGGGNTDSRFVGTWITSFGDDLPVGNGRRQYALRIAITRNGDALTGNGTMLRYFNNGPDAVDDPARTISATGAATGNEATLTVAGTSGTFTNNPVWYLRIADSRLVGMYAERDNSLVVQRSGHAIWHPAGSVDLNASWLRAARSHRRRNTFPQRQYDHRPRLLRRTAFQRRIGTLRFQRRFRYARRHASTIHLHRLHARQRRSRLVRLSQQQRHRRGIRPVQQQQRTRALRPRHLVQSWRHHTRAIRPGLDHLLRRFRGSRQSLRRLRNGNDRRVRRR